MTEKRILHPGEVNALRRCHQRSSIVCTHSDTSVVYVWDTDAAEHCAQSRRAKGGHTSKAAVAAPAVTLVGHEQMAQFALDCSRQSPLVLSGGQDNLVLLWSLDDNEKAAPYSGIPSSPQNTRGPILYPKAKFVGHTDTVEAVACHPTSVSECCSVGDDKLLLFWDTRVEGHKPSQRVEGMHNDDINCVAWNSLAPELVATGDSDGIVRVFDSRSLGKPLHTFGAANPDTEGAYSWMSGNDNDDEAAAAAAGVGHTGSVLSLQWMPHARGILASGGDDCVLRVWDLGAEKGDDGGQSEGAQLFVHAGHRHPLVDIDWNEHSPATLASVSEPSDGGSKLQLWRVSPTVAEGWDMQLAEGEAVGSIAASELPETMAKYGPDLNFPQQRSRTSAAAFAAGAESSSSDDDAGRTTRSRGRAAEPAEESGQGRGRGRGRGGGRGRGQRGGRARANSGDSDSQSDDDSGSDTKLSEKVPHTHLGRAPTRMHALIVRSLAPRPLGAAVAVAVVGARGAVAEPPPAKAPRAAAVAAAAQPPSMRLWHT